MDEAQNQVITDDSPAEDSRLGALRFALDILETLLLSALLYLAINGVSVRIRVDGTSMEPTLHNGEFIIVNKLSYRLGEFSRGDVVVFHLPRDPQQEYIKRVIGLPGDVVEVRNGQVHINGEPIDEPYIAARPNYPGTWIVPQGNVFVLGDNRNNSSDSHTWGTVPVDYVVGKALLIYWPPPEWGAIDHVASAAP